MSDVFGCPEGSKRSKSLKWRRWSSFRSKITQAALFHTCPTFFGVLRAPKHVLGAQNAFWSNFCTSAPQNHQETSDTYDKKRFTQDWRTFSSKVLLGSTWGTLGPAGAEAGWLAAEGSELRAEGSRLGPPPAATTPSPQQPHPPAAQPPPLLSPKVGILASYRISGFCMDPHTFPFQIPHPNSTPKPHPWATSLGCGL